MPGQLFTQYLRTGDIHATPEDRAQLQAFAAFSHAARRLVHHFAVAHGSTETQTDQNLSRPCLASSVGPTTCSSQLPSKSTGPERPLVQRRTHGGPGVQTRTGPTRRRPPVTPSAARGRGDPAALESHVMRTARKSPRRPVGSSAGGPGQNVSLLERTIAGSLLFQP